jgi:hypothetical protein
MPSDQIEMPDDRTDERAATRRRSIDPTAVLAHVVGFCGAYLIVGTLGAWVLEALGIIPSWGLAPSFGALLNGTILLLAGWRLLGGAVRRRDPDEQLAANPAGLAVGDLRCDRSVALRAAKPSQRFVTRRRAAPR